MSDDQRASAVVPSVAAPREAAPARSYEHAGVVVIDRLDHTDSPSVEFLPAGWKTVLANSPLAAVFQQFLASAGVGWSAAVLPEEQHAAFTATGAVLPPVTPVARGILPRAEWLAGMDGGQGACAILNGHLFPLCDLRSSIDQHAHSRCDATLIELHDLRHRPYDERLLVGANGAVRRVARLYDGAPDTAGHLGCWPAMILLSAGALRSLVGLTLPPRLADWPAVMLRAGLRLQGRSVHGRCIDLHAPDQVRELADLVLREHPGWLRAAGGLREHAPGVWVGADVRIAPTAQLLAPVALGDGVEIGDDAIVVGPVAVGRGARIGRGAVLRQTVLEPGAIVTVSPSRPPGDGVGRTDAAESRRWRRRRPDLAIRLQRVIEAGPRYPFGGFRYQAFHAVKRAMDIAGAVLFLLMTLPFYPLIAMGIKCSSPGPVFYGHWRQGRGGRNFRCWKFRTMVSNAEAVKQRLMAHNEVDGPQFKMKDDPRIFRFGRLLRKLNIDEWPQFFNVLLGQMSLVGPRPSPEQENQLCPAWREARLSVRPGITGLWQVSRVREGDTDFQEWIYYDVLYVKRQSVLLDLKILLQTIRVMVRGT